jgi:hypothetical protein
MFSTNPIEFDLGFMVHIVVEPNVHCAWVPALATIKVINKLDRLRKF